MEQGKEGGRRPESSFLLDLSPGRPARRTRQKGPLRHRAHCVPGRARPGASPETQRAPPGSGPGKEGRGAGWSGGRFFREASIAGSSLRAERSWEAGVSGSPGANKERGTSGPSKQGPLPTEAWPGAQGVLKSDFKVKKPDSEAVAMLQ